MRHTITLGLVVLIAAMIGPRRAVAAVDHTEVRVDVVWFDTGQSQYVSAPYFLDLRDNDAPMTVDNFKGYITSGDYDYTIIHRSAHFGDGSPFVLQGGGFWVTNAGGGIVAPQYVVDYGTIDSEFDPATMSNLRGTIAMARLGNDENSATNEWFINMADNTFLDYADNPSVVGFTVFGDVVNTPEKPGMDFLDDVASLQTYDFSLAGVTPRVSAWSDIPLINYTPDDYAAGVPLQFGFLLYTIMTITAEPLIGDVNRDDAANLLDIVPFVSLITTLPSPYQTEADLNRDGAVNLLDINPFVALIVQSGGGSAVPEPASLVLLIAAGLLLVARRRLRG